MSLSPAQLSVIYVKASYFAAHKHRNQRRKNKKTAETPKTLPYVNHCLEVANFLVCYAGVTDQEILAAAALHDTLEDTETTYEELVAEFGQRIASLVQEVTDAKNVTNAERKRLQLAKAPTLSHAAKLIKLADKLHNCRYDAPVGWTKERFQGYQVWCREVVNCLRGTDKTLEDLFDAAQKREFEASDGLMYPYLAEGETQELLENFYRTLDKKDAQIIYQIPERKMGETVRFQLHVK